MKKQEILEIRTPTGIIIKIPLNLIRTFQLDVLGGYRVCIIEEK